MKSIKGVSTVQSNKRTTSINLPKAIVDAIKIEKGDRVFIEAFEDGTIIIKK